MVQSSWELGTQNQLLRACIPAPSNCSSAELGGEPGAQEDPAGWETRAAAAEGTLSPGYRGCPHETYSHLSEQEEQGRHGPNSFATGMTL